MAVGDEVIYGKYAGNDIEVNGKELKILRESDILAKVDEISVSPFARTRKRERST